MRVLRRCTGLALIISGSVMVTCLASWGQAPFQVGGAWRQVYEQLPNFPKENQYINQATGTVKANSTLASRLIQYHVYVKGRVPNSRIDWKLTLADYLGLNEVMFEARYPEVDNLKTSPFESDRTIIKQFNRQQREALIEAMVKVLTPSVSRSRRSPEPQQPQSPAKTVSPPAPQIPHSPKAGDANLLKI